jgi:hypothetical protein
LPFGFTTFDLQDVLGGIMQCIQHLKITLPGHAESTVHAMQAK